MRRRAILGYCAAVSGALVLTIFAGWWQVEGPGAPLSSRTRPLTLTAMDFNLTDHEGRAVGPDTLVGRPTMMLFGFTFCPDICPTTLIDISGWLDAMEEDAERLNVIFITVDPERDTVDALAEYVGHFDPAIRGWTGSIDQITRAAEDLGVVYEKVPTSAGDYTMKHTASVILFDAEGRFAGTIDYHEPRETALPKIRLAME